MNFKFEPWNLIPDVDLSITTIPDPPCRHCMYWNPQLLIMQDRNGITPNGCRLCWSKEIEYDFSCYKPKEL